MAGSLADFKYFDDRNRPFLVRIDKSNALRAGTGFVVITQPDLLLDYIPSNVKIRYVVARHPTRPINRKIYCQSLTAPLWIGSQTSIQLIDYQDNSLQDFVIINREFEKKLFTAKLFDTYQSS